jgi:hypothetical protein
MDDFLLPALQQLDRIKRLLERLSLRYENLPPLIVGGGVAVPVTASEYCVVSISAGGNENVLNITIGILRDIVRQDRLGVLDACNTRTRDNSAYPLFLHDAEAGWDILMQTRLPVNLLTEAPGFLDSLIRNLPLLAADHRIELQRQFGGIAYQWESADLYRLGIRSLM